MNVERAARTLWAAFLSGVVSMLLLLIAAQATVTTTTIQPATNSLILSLSGPEANPQANEKITAGDINLGNAPSSSSLSSNMAELIDLTAAIDTNFDGIFNLGLGPITQQNAAVDIDQILLTNADTGPPIMRGPSRHTQNIATLELVAGGLSSTTFKRSGFSSSTGFPFSLVAISVLLLGAGLISLAFMVFRRHI